MGRPGWVEQRERGEEVERLTGPRSQGTLEVAHAPPAVRQRACGGKRAEEGLDRNVILTGALWLVC